MSDAPKAITTVPTKAITLTEDEWTSRFQPEEGDGWVKQRSWYDATDRALIAQAMDERRCWTMVDDGVGNQSLVQGGAVVNYQYHVLCAVPYAEGEVIMIAYNTEDQLFCTMCGEWFIDQSDSDGAVVRSTVEPMYCVECHDQL